MTLQLLAFRLKHYIQYQFRAVGPHALHSPFLFDLYNRVIKPSQKHRLPEVEMLRKKLQDNKELIEVSDFKLGTLNIRSIGDEFRSSSSSRKFSSFLHLLLNYLSVNTVLETGTSLGLNTLYLAASNAQSIITIEGSRIISQLAQKNFDLLGFKGIQLRNEDLYQCLEQEIVQYKPEFYFLDADHRSSCIAFCIDLILKHTPEAKCIVIHDIYWSRDMYELWTQLTEDPRFTLSIDIFQAGILFPNQEMPKQHFILRF